MTPCWAHGVSRQFPSSSQRGRLGSQKGAELGLGGSWGLGTAEERKRGDPCRELRGLSLGRSGGCPGPRVPQRNLKRVDLRVSVALGLTSVVGLRCAQQPVRTPEPEPGVEPDM